MTSSTSYNLQFLSEVGDEDDAADEYLALISSEQSTSNSTPPPLPRPSIHIYAGSTDDSAHYLTYEFYFFNPTRAEQCQ